MSNEPTIDAMNEAIAVFDGWRFIKGDPNHKCNFCFAGDEPCIPAMDRFLKDSDMRFRCHFQYHSSWDVLHQAWDKFKALNFIHHPNVSDFMAHLDRISNYMAFRTIEETHEVIFKAIQWYNNQSTTTNEKVST